MRFNLWTRALVVASVLVWTNHGIAETESQVRPIVLTGLSDVQVITFDPFTIDGTVTSIEWSFEPVHTASMSGECCPPSPGGEPTGCETCNEGAAAIGFDGLVTQAYTQPQVDPCVAPPFGLVSPPMVVGETYHVENIYDECVQTASSSDPDDIAAALAGPSVMLGSVGQWAPINTGGIEQAVLAHWGGELRLTVTFTPTGGGGGECGCADLDGDGVITIGDFIAVILAWGICESSECPEDVNCDGSVDVLDLLELIVAWQSGVDCD